MAEKSVLSKPHGHLHEEDLPPPPPTDSLQKSASVPGDQDSSSMPLPPPKEIFSKFYQQRQINELKRLYRHMHPELRKNLEEVVAEDLDEVLAEVLGTEDTKHQASVNLDTEVPGEVQSMRWIFENWALDSIGQHQAKRKLKEEETIISGDVKSTSQMFENQTFEGDSSQFSISTRTHEEHQVGGDVRTALWLFETQPLDSLNKIYPEEGELQEAVLKEPYQRGDVKGAKRLFETNSLDDLGRCNSVEEGGILQLQSEIQELKGNVKKTVKLFQTEQLCAIQDNTGNIHKIKSICREEVQSDNVRTARWLFETQPLATINKDTSGVKLIRGISLEETEKGGVGKTRWIFETQPLDTIKEHTAEEDFKASIEPVPGGDVNKQRWLFETKSLASLKGEVTESSLSKEEIVGGDVQSTLWLFETLPMENLKDSFEVGHLKEVKLKEEEKGAVREQRLVFENCPLDSICKDSSEAQRKIEMQEEEKGDVKCYKHLFETLSLDSIQQHESNSVTKCEEILAGNVKANKTFFETVPLYAIKDYCGNYHEVTSVSREQVIKGDVKNYKWMFETRPLDRFNDGVKNVELIKGITKQEILSGDVDTAKWLFETQPFDFIHSQVNQGEQHSSVKKEVLQKGDVRTYRWLFETQPMDALYEKSEKKQEESLPKADVKSYTWMFETQPLDSLNENGDQYLVVCAKSKEDVKGIDVKTVKHLFETEPLDYSSSGINTKQFFRYVSKVDVQSGDVSRMKEIFESKPLDAISESATTIEKTEVAESQSIEAGTVHKFTWLFENCPIDVIKENTEEQQQLYTVTDIKGGDVGSKRFIFETYSLDQIHEADQSLDFKGAKEEIINKGDIKSCTMLFETQPLYAIRDKDGQYHEVTTVKKEEVMRGDIRGARWMFETKPLDTIKPDDEIFVIRAVTQEDVMRGDVRAARWRFETQPLDSIMDESRTVMRTVDDIQRGDVQTSKQLFETQKINQKKYVRMVSVSDVQQGNVRTSTWLFENQPIDTLKGELEESSGVAKVHREDIRKGDVKRCSWLFETQPLDSLKDSDTSAEASVKEEIPTADVKSTTWLFETMPLDKFISSNSKEMVEYTEKSVKESLQLLYSYKIIQSSGIIIEANEIDSVKMAKYKLTNQDFPEIQKEEIVGGNLQKIMLQLLHKTNVEPQGVLVTEDEKGNIETTKLQLLNQAQSSIKKEDDVVKGDISQAIHSLSHQDASVKKGIVMQETEQGNVQMTIYSLLNHSEQISVQQEIIKGDVKSTIDSLLASAQEKKTTTTVKREENEKGNVCLYRSCIEKGALEYLKNLQDESDDPSLDISKKEQVEIILGDVAGAKRHLLLQKGEAEKTVADILPGDVKSTKMIFMSENVTVQGTPEKLLHHDNSTAVQSFEQPVKQSVTTEKEEVVSGDVKATLQSLEKAKTETKEIKKEIVVHGNIKETKAALKEAAFTKAVTEKEDVIKSELHTNVYSSEEPTKIVDSSGTDLQAAMQDLRKAAAEAKTIQHQVQSKLQQCTESHVDVHTHLVTEQKMGVQCTMKVQMSEQKHEAGVSKQNVCSVAGVKESSISKTSQQQSKSLQQKVSACEDVKRSIQSFEIGHESEGDFSTDASVKDGVYTAKKVETVINPFKDSGYKDQCLQEEAEQEGIIRGDVKAAIKALQSAATDQKPVEKEHVVRGNLTAALQSLEKSNINVSKGDFKAAMIYRNAGQSCLIEKKKIDALTICNEPAKTSVLYSDTEFPPSAAVTKTRCLHPKEQSRDEVTSEFIYAEPPTKTSESPPVPQQLGSKITSIVPPQASEKSMSMKPVIPPKPETLTSCKVSMQGKKPILPPKPKHLQENVVLSNPAKAISLKTDLPSLPKKTKDLCDTAKSDLPVTPTGNSLQVKALGQPKRKTHSEVYSMQSDSVDNNVEKTGTELKSFKVGKTALQIAEEKYKKQNKEHRQETVNPKRNLKNFKPENQEDEMSTKKISPAEEIQGCMQSYSEEGETRKEILHGFKAALHNFGDQKKQNSLEASQDPPMKKGVIITRKSSALQKDASIVPCRSVTVTTQETNTKTQHIASNTSATNNQSEKQDLQMQQKTINKSEQAKFTHQPNECSQHSIVQQQQQESLNQVVLREKKKKTETEDERRKRLSVHKEEIMRGNVKAAMEIFENLRKREELQKILSKVKEFEEETCKVDVKSLKGFFENVPQWVVDNNDVHLHIQSVQEKDEKSKAGKEDTESICPMELVFEDLERASTEINHLKEQTLAKLLEIEDSIKKALYSVCNLKSESDIAGLSGLFRESLGCVQSPIPSNNIRKISIVTSKAKMEKEKQVVRGNVMDNVMLPEKTERKRPVLEVPSIQPRVNSPSSPSYISIESAARKPIECPKSISFTVPLQDHSLPAALQSQTGTEPSKFAGSDISSSTKHKAVLDDYGAEKSSQTKAKSTECLKPCDNDGAGCDSSKNAAGCGSFSNFRGGISNYGQRVNQNNTSSPMTPRRQKSVIEFKTGPKEPEIIGTKTVTEKYEETDQYGNKIITSKTSTTVTKQSETKSSSTYEVVSTAPRYEVMSPPLVSKHVHCPVEESQSNGNLKESSFVRVTFSNSKSAKK
ncbi:LIM domain-containing protein [Latimeria chalumnae]|uniref:LIM domain-containing protein n=1 Tax=Latimeria chalumnae TaxID=7897 RepID=UPI0003C16133|nr:PREDICTED: xin actin-binding repeat-containing protein 1-like [Latimeria chalumnae]|eukprot:XP_006003282.1 PREDICTED: xin actin-binding repeat-containing protein 1-like [Latimeria chalumnae]